MNKVELDGKVSSSFPIIYYAKDQFRVETEIDYRNPDTNSRHRFVLQVRGGLASQFYSEWFPGRAVSQIEGYLKASTMGRTKIVVRSYEFSDPVEDNEETSAMRTRKQEALDALNAVRERRVKSLAEEFEDAVSDMDDGSEDVSEDVSEDDEV
jgi:hypothetical protein